MNEIRLKYLLRSNDGGVWGSDPLGDETDVVVLRSTEQTSEGQWNISEPAKRHLSPSEARAFVLEVGDVLVTKSSGSPTHIGKATLVDAYVASLGAAYSNFMQRLRPTDAFDSRFLWYFLGSMQARSQLDQLSTTTTGLNNLTGGMLGELVLTRRSVVEQRAIADYLDRETAQIDAFITKNEELIQLIKERADAQWSALMEIATGAGPSVQLRRLLRSLVDGPFGSSLTSAHYTESGTRVIRLGNVGINEFRSEDVAYISSEYAQHLGNHATTAGDVVIAGLGDERMPLGRACVVPEIGPAIVKADCYRARPNHLVTAQYLAWALSSPPSRAQLQLLGRGSTRQRLNTSVVGELLIPLPPIGIQNDLVTRHAAMQGRAQERLTLASDSIALAKERRAAIISAAVTGKIDVRSAA